MAHFAKIGPNGIVETVIVVANEDCLDENGNESEAVGQAFIASIGLDGEWKQTSYHTYRGEDGVSIHRNGGTPFRGTYAGAGMFYNAELDVFESPVAVEEPA